MNQVGNFIALIKAFPLNGQVRNSGPAQSAFIRPNTRERAKQNCDVAIFNAGIPQRLNPFNDLFGIAFARARRFAFAFFIAVKFLLRLAAAIGQHADEQLDQRRLIFGIALSHTRFVAHITELC